MDPTATESALTPEAAFGLLGNETRIAIVRALGESLDESLSFSELRERAGVRDSGQFNYHLDRLVGSFVRRAEEGGYELTYAGARVVGAILAGTFNEKGGREEFDLDAACPTCGSAISARYEDEQVTVRCPDCDEQISLFGFPPGGFENRDTAELTRTFDRWLRNVFSMMADGICFNCTGRTRGSLTTESEYIREGEDAAVELICERCGNTATASVGSYVLHHPAVVAFHYEHGIDLGETPAWDLTWLRDKRTTLDSRDPLRARVTVELDGDALELLVDERLDVAVSKR